ncbi:MAG: hypothetical protein FJ404_01725 [Verrucomicrobia bacterium]|nr:hypothetical protein [Verrucomicrobiota bacterium]
MVITAPTLVWLLAALPFLAGGLPAFPSGKFGIEPSKEGVAIRNRDGHVVARYQTVAPAGTGLSVESGAFFHPLTTPSGLVMTDLAPADHKHHRGLFLGWVEVRGTKKGDFWGWGEPAPKVGRVIRHRGLRGVRAFGVSADFQADNEWVADQEVLINETLEAKLRSAPDANVLELTYKLTPTAPTQLGRWAFGGFCVRLRKEGRIEAFNPAGKVALPDPVHTKPESDWPDAPWYGFTIDFPDGKRGGVAVVQHPSNPPTWWHNHRVTRMINPCITAPAEVALDPTRPLVLRYRVVIHDGPAPVALLDRLAAEWARPARR